MLGKTPFLAVERRAIASRLTIAEMLEKAGVSRVTYWRAKNGHHRRPDGAMVTLRKLEAAMDAFERVALCGLCDRRADDPAVRDCTHSDCGLAQKQVA